MKKECNFCFQCGTKLKVKGGKFCHNCGQELEAETEIINVPIIPNPYQWINPLVVIPAINPASPPWDPYKITCSSTSNSLYSC
jgi:hypothetical protein